MIQPAKHTPWTVRRDDSGGEIGLWSVIDANENIVFFGMEEDRARLFAAAPDMLVALKLIDSDWTSEFPDGPEGSREWAGGIGRLSDGTVEIWRSIRAAIANAEPHP